MLCQFFTIITTPRMLVLLSLRFAADDVTLPVSKKRAHPPDTVAATR